ncbi:MAG: cobalamin biosynthesis protein, partial [Bacteroidaceae bacterium]|nr:cobalamin biosynthesis protein [Bacteroidaceae bacterium]
MLGVPGMVAYKMVNTFDSMIGYRNERYKDFGCWAARIDDVANYVPARLTAFLILLASKIRGMVGMVKGKSAGWKELLGFVAFFGSKHASPNSGWPEAALAGLLDCRFGGGHNYFGQYFYKPFIGTNERKLTTSDMRLSVRISLVAEILMVVILLLSLLVPSLFHLHSL